MVTEPIEGGGRAMVHPSQLGGTRHLSAAQFVHDQRDAIALVASQDGRFTVFAWSPCENRSTRTASRRCCCREAGSGSGLPGSAKVFRGRVFRPSSYHRPALVEG